VVTDVDGRSCASWPFLTKDEKVEWLQPEHMCTSVLSPRQVGLVSQFDINAKKGDVGGAYMGQDPRLLWAKPCLAKFHQHLKKLKQIPKENEPMSSDFLQKNPDVYKKGLRKGWFTEASEKIWKDPPGMSTSLAELKATTCESTLDKMKNKDHCRSGLCFSSCPKEMWQNMLNACVQAEKLQFSAQGGSP